MALYSVRANDYLRAPGAVGLGPDEELPKAVLDAFAQRVREASEVCAAAIWDPLAVTLTDGGGHICGHGYSALLQMEERTRLRLETLKPLPTATLAPVFTGQPWAYVEPVQWSTMDERDEEGEPLSEHVAEIEALHYNLQQRAEMLRAMLKLADIGVYGSWSDLRARFGLVTIHYSAACLAALLAVGRLDLDSFDPGAKGSDLFEAALIEGGEEDLSWQAYRQRLTRCGAWKSRDTLSENLARLRLAIAEAQAQASATVPLAD